MKCGFLCTCLVKPEASLSESEISEVLRSVTKQQVSKSLERLIVEGRIAASQVQMRYHDLMEHVGHD